jgi:hypothetical protein
MHSSLLAITLSIAAPIAAHGGVTTYKIDGVTYMG